MHGIKSARRGARALRAPARQRGFSFVAVIAGFLFAALAAYLVLLGLGAVFGKAAFAVDLEQWTREQQQASTSLPPPYTLTFLCVLLIASAVVDVAAGWVAAKVGNESPMTNAFAVGLVGCVLTLLMPQSENLFPAWYNIIAFVTIIPLMLAGAYIAMADE